MEVFALVNLSCCFDSTLRSTCLVRVASMPPARQPENAKFPHQNSVPYAYIVSPVGIGRKEVWKDETKGSKKPQPIAYECVIRSGPVPTITIRRPIDPTKGVPAQRQLPNRTNPPVLERHSSTATPGYHPQPPSSPRSATTKSNRESSPLSIEYQRPNFEIVKRKPLPSLPRIKSGSLESETFESALERSFIDGSESSETEISTRTFTEPPQRSVRRSFVINPVNATPRLPRTPQISLQSFEEAEDIISPVESVKGQSPWTPNPEPGLVARNAPGSLCDILPSQNSKFAEYTDKTDGESMLWKRNASMLDISSTAPPIPEKSSLRISSTVDVSFDEWKESRRAGTLSRGRIRLPTPVAGTSTVSLPTASRPKPTATLRRTTSVQARPSTLADIICLAEAKPVMICAVVPSGTARLVGS